MLRTKAAPASSKLVVRLAIAGMALAVAGLGALALVGAFVTERGAANVTSAALQTTGHLRAVQALSMIDNHTDALEDEFEPAVVGQLARAQQALDESLLRMAGGGDPEAAAISRAGRPIADRLHSAVAVFLDARRRDADSDATEDAEDAMEDEIHELETLVHDIQRDPSDVLTSKLDGVTDSLGTVRGFAFVLVPVGLGFVGVAAWLLRLYRRRSDQAIRGVLAASEAEARTDQLTGLANRRALFEELDARVATGEELVLAIADLNGFKRYNDTYGHPAGDALLRRLAGSLAATFAGRGTAARLGGDEFCVLVPGALAEDEVHALVCSALSEEGEGFAISASCGLVSLPRDAADSETLLRVADARMYAVKTGSRDGVEHFVSRALLRMLDERHPGLGEHVEHVAELAGRCATGLGMSSEEVAATRRAAELHDIGKVGIPASILTKPERLDADEWDFMRTHTIIGERILTAVPGLRPIAGIVRSSHERWDGGGYPDGLAGEEIPLAARVVAVTDAFCAMTEDRPYAQARSAEVALAELERCAGTQFDADVVRTFVGLVQAHGAGAAAA